ncbi:MAG: diguanylate cyclase [Fimbriimonadaceae bacterium]|nr:diguanylate cyclase [Fimbriimonadaceae bacterium]
MTLLSGPAEASAKSDTWLGVVRVNLLCATAVCLFALGSIYLSRQPGSIASIWLANGVAAAVLLMRPAREWKWLILSAAVGNLTANLLYGDPLLVSSSFLPGNAVDILLCAALIRYFNIERDWSSHPRRFLRFLAVGVCVPPILGASIGALTIQSHGFGSFQSVWADWYIGDVIGFLLVLPAALASLQCAAKTRFQCNNLVKTILVTIGTVGITCLILNWIAYPFILVAFTLIGVSIFFRLPTVAISTSVTAIVITQFDTWIGLSGNVNSPSHRTDVLIATVAVCLGPLMFATMRESQILAESRLDEAFKKLRENFRGSPAMLQICSEQGVLQKVSDQWLKTLNVSREDVIGTKFEDFLDPQSRTRYNQYNSKPVNASGSRGTVDLTIVAHDGLEIQVEYSATTQWHPETGIATQHGFLRNVTQERLLAANVEAEIEWLTATLESVSEAVILLSSDGHIRFLNPTAEELLGVSFVECMGMQFISIASLEASKNPTHPPDWRTLTTSTGVQKMVRFKESIINAQGGDTRGRVVVLSDIDDVAVVLSEQYQLARTDKLTGVSNRLGFQDSVREACRQACPFSLVSIDLDGFKRVNDVFGHDAGDYVLSTVAERISRGIRGVDTVARLGGDEFVVLLSGVGTRGQSEKIVQYLASHVSHDLEIHGEPSGVTLSFGISIFMQDASDLDELLKLADEALYVAKRAGKNCYRFASDLPAAA